ncbi:MAG: hypothetical protein ABSH30_16755 [Acidimicrobiales bacterium]|jgi:hypothetical protein
MADTPLSGFAPVSGMATSHAAEFFALLGGGLRDAGWDGSLRTGNRLAILPGLTHFDIFGTPQLAAVVEEFIA